MDIKRTVLIRQIDLWTKKPFHTNKIRLKNANQNISFLFFSEILCFKTSAGTPNCMTAFSSHAKFCFDIPCLML